MYKLKTWLYEFVASKEFVTGGVSLLLMLSIAPAIGPIWVD
jgi:hypothetical protein